jgi:hypothetical protein
MVSLQLLKWFCFRPGCYRCHRGLRHCDVPVEDIAEGLHKVESIEALNVYPEDEGDVLATWNERARQWEDIDRNGAGRVMACSEARKTYHYINEDRY